MQTHFELAHTHTQTRVHTNTPEHATQQHQYPVVHTHQMTGNLRAQAAMMTGD